MNLLNGKELSASLRASIASRASNLQAHLAIVSATSDEGSAWYVRSLVAAASKVGIAASVVSVEVASELTATLTRLSADPAVHGIILQTPLPSGQSRAELGRFIDPAKDVDGSNPLSFGLLTNGLPAFAPATATAVIAILDHYEVPLEGKHVVVVGRSAVVGKPVAHLLLDRNATVTICHSRTPSLATMTQRADVLVAAVGRAGLITPTHVRPGAVVIDVGTNPTADGKLVGDVAPEVASVAGALTPVPGGVGPVTTALLLANVVQAAEHLAAVDRA